MILKNYKMKRGIIISEDEKREIRKMHQIKEEDEKRFCHSKNTKTIEEIIGDTDGAEDYIKGVKIRKTGVNGLTDMIEALKTIRLYPSISDGGEHLSYQLANILKGLKPYNYFDPTVKKCDPVMNKIIQLYKENEHGEELVKDIEKVYASNSLSPKAKEYLRYCVDLIKNKNN